MGCKVLRCQVAKICQTVYTCSYGVAGWFFRYYPLILSGTFLLLLSMILTCNPGYLARLPETVPACYFRNAVQGRVGSGYFGGSGNQIDFSMLKPGDILLGGKPGGAYGHFTHAGLYLGEGQVIEGYVDCGVTRQEVECYHRYDWACILRVKAPDDVRKKAVEYASRQEGKLFYPGAFKPGERYWNCTKLIWAAYYRQGIDLDSGQDLWITPDAICHSSWVMVVAREENVP